MKLEETERNKKNLKKKTHTKNRKKLDDTQRYWMILRETVLSVLSVCSVLFNILYFFFFLIFFIFFLFTWENYFIFFYINRLYLKAFIREFLINIFFL